MSDVPLHTHKSSFSHTRTHTHTRINIQKDYPEAFAEDLKRDVIKSNSAGVVLPELDVEVTQGSLGGMYTTVEGLLDLVQYKLFEGQASR